MKIFLSCQPNSAHVCMKEPILNISMLIYILQVKSIPAGWFLLFQFQVHKTYYSYSNNREGVDSKIKTCRTSKGKKKKTFTILEGINIEQDITLTFLVQVNGEFEVKPIHLK